MKTATLVIVAAALLLTAGLMPVAPVEAKKADKKEREARAARVSPEARAERKAARAEKARPAKKASRKKGYAGPAEVVGRLAHGPIRESSGLVASRRFPGVFWTHNDKGNDPALFAVRRDGSLLAEYRVAVEAAEDWEDVAVDDDGRLYVADTGNNDLARRGIAVHRLAEPAAEPSAAAAKGAAPARVDVERTWRLTYPGEPFDCESLFIHGGHGFVVSKRRDGGPAGLYRFPLDGPRDVTLEHVADLPVRSAVTAADLSADGQRLAILSPAGLALFEVAGRPERAGTGAAAPKVLPLPKRKLEGLAFADGGLLLTAESREVYFVKP